MLKITKHNQRGETIIEVLVCLAILGAVIGLSFGTSNRNLQAMRNSQERGEALKIAEGQIEKISAQPSIILSQPPGTYCIRLTDGALQFSPCNSGIYTYSITKNNLRITSTVTWNRLGGGGQQQRLEIIYEVRNE